MPNKQSRTQNKRKTKGRGSQVMVASAPVWAPGGSGPELKTWSSQNGNYQLYHNVPVAALNSTNLLDSIALGTGVSQRIGARIFAKRLRGRIVFNNKPDRPNVSYRCAVTAAPAAPNSDFFSELFVHSGITGIHLPTNSLLLHDAVFPLNQGSGMENNMTPNKERSFNHTFEIMLNHPVVYNTADGKCTTQLTVWFVAYDAFGTLITDNIASVAQVTMAIDYTDD